jgi:hypothetical protein
VRHRVIVLAALAFSGCSAPAGDGAEPRELAAAFVAAARGCTAPLVDGHLDERGLAAAGWKIVKKTRRADMLEIVGPDGYMRPVRIEVEDLRAERGGSPMTLSVTRSWGLPAVPQFQDPAFYDRCTMSLEATDAETITFVQAALREVLGRATASGEQPAGGDWLLPRFQQRDYAISWQRPQHDVTLTTRTDAIALEITAMPKRPPESDAVRRLRNASIVR